mgnify:FL=1
MATNQYVNTTSVTSEQSLVENLVVESIQIHGQDFYYIKRDLVNADTVFNEDTLSKYETAWQIEMYIEDTDGFQGEGDFLSKFGLEVRDQLNVVVSKKRFAEEKPDYDTPREGDLIYWPLVDKIFEIQFVEDEASFYQLGKIYVYRLQTEVWEYSHESINTGIEEIDDIVDTHMFSVDMTLGTGAGDYTVGEQVYQGSTLETADAKGQVVTWNAGTKVLKVNHLTGDFTSNVNVIGAQSNTSYLLGATQELIYTQDRTVDNDIFTTSAQADDIIDFSVTNPFSEGY